MTFSDETLMAFADGELDEANRHAVEAALRRDPAVAHKVAQFQALRVAVCAAYAPVLEETLPPRLLRLLRPLPAAKVVQLDAVRAAKGGRSAPPAKAGAAWRWSWIEWTAVALALVAGVGVGRFILPDWAADREAAVAGADGALMARGELAQALSEQTAGIGPVGAKVAIGISFVSNQGVYCRSFVMDGAGQDLAGLACRSGAQWAIPVLLQQTKRAMPADRQWTMQEAPSAVQEAIERRIDSAALDSKAEQEALRKDWHR
ncbi:anti-sigma factor family protein [Janthinobacterium fluminis]|uniref:Anti-sigma factor n=1 Tax=Janthinobacterium fluminis TaxID=2987524 RepID=A0ABT5JXS0_9BURK|nr:hypothetical protein [Janthinobacterium fluminis]MDC8757230.1 hypothetical protein [Janthinobacterium fluminis]